MEIKRAVLELSSLSMDDFKQNHCRFCPKVFCCMVCRYEHEETTHCIKVSEKKAKPTQQIFPFNIINKMQKPSIHSESFKQPHPLNVNEQNAKQSPNTPFQGVKNIVAKFDLMATSTPYMRSIQPKIMNMPNRESSKNVELQKQNTENLERKEVITSTDDLMIREGNATQFFTTITSIDENNEAQSSKLIEETKELQEETVDSTIWESAFNSLQLTEASNESQTDSLASLHIDTSSENVQDTVKSGRSRQQEQTISVIHSPVPCEINEPMPLSEIKFIETQGKTDKTEITSRKRGKKQSVWKEIALSFRQALSSTIEILNHTSTSLKRSIDISEQNLPLPKRKKFEQLVKCRPPIRKPHHDDSYLHWNIIPVLKVDKATQTEDSYFS